MNTVTITAIVSSKCTQKAIGYATDPKMTEEIIKEANSMIEHTKLRLSLSDGFVIVEGSVWPPSNTIASSTAEILSEAHKEVIKRKDLAEANHKSLVDQYAQAAGLPVIEG